jgi:Fe-S-cluster containining protein
MIMDPMLTFSCTSCGRCCHDLRLTLSLAEALRWIERGGTVQILADALPDLGPDGEQSAFRYARSFQAVSGSLPISVSLTLVARFEGACPNLQPDMRCGAYEERPNICKIYPAETNSERMIRPSDRLCPSEAWEGAGDGETALPSDGSMCDAETRDALDSARRKAIAEVEAKRLLAQDLGIDRAALANAGFAVWSPPAEPFAAALRRRLADASPAGAPVRDWCFVSDKSALRDMFRDAGVSVADLAEDGAPDYLALG